MLSAVSTGIALLSCSICNIPSLSEYSGLMAATKTSAIQAACVSDISSIVPNILSHPSFLDIWEVSFTSLFKSRNAALLKISTDSFEGTLPGIGYSTA